MPMNVWRSVLLLKHLYKQSFVSRRRGPFLLWEKEKTSLFYWILLHNQEKKIRLAQLVMIYFFLKFHICTQNSSHVYDAKKLLYIFILCSNTLETPRPGFLRDWRVWWTQHNSMAVWKIRAGIYAPALLHLSGLAQVSAAAAAILSFAPWRGRAILGWWSVSVGGAGCCFAHCWGRCWRSGASWGRWWCLGS